VIANELKWLWVT